MTHHLFSGIATLFLSSVAACTSAPIQPSAQQASVQACINPARIREHEVVSNDEVRFTLAGGEVWSNKLTRSCPGLKTQGGFTWDVSTSICGGLQTIYVNESGIPCQLGEFTRVATTDAAG